MVQYWAGLGVTRSMVSSNGFCADLVRVHGFDVRVWALAQARDLADEGINLRLNRDEARGQG